MPPTRGPWTPRRVIISLVAYGVILAILWPLLIAVGFSVFWAGFIASFPAAFSMDIWRAWLRWRGRSSQEQ